MNNPICIKLNLPKGTFDVLIGDTDPDMIVCKDEAEAERSLYQEYVRAAYFIRDEYNRAVNKIREQENGKD
jgi:hypothetical protein